MQRFTQLFTEMDRTKRTSEKLAALERYFREAPPEDAAWALFFLSGRKIKRLVPTSLIDGAIRRKTNLPGWLIGESYEAVGDVAELMALLWPDDPPQPIDLPLHVIVSARMLALRHMADPAQQRDSILQTWSEMDFDQRLVFNKLLTGNFRVGVTQTLVIRALATIAQVPAAVMAHRFAGQWEATAESFVQLLRGGEEIDRRAQPYPFYLAYPLEQPPQELGDLRDWQAEWKYDGLRAQVIRRADEVLIWSRGDELITPAFDEIAQAAKQLAIDTVLDGEIVAWESSQQRPLPFALLQRRINRKATEAMLWSDVPVAFIAFDVLESEGVDVREREMRERRAVLEEVVCAKPQAAAGASSDVIRIAPLIDFHSWDELAQKRLQSRQLAVEGVMLKRLDSTYGAGRRRGDWWKWKIDPYTVDAVLIYAQGGSGRRAGVFTDYTFGVWNEDRSELVPVAKAYSGLTDDEIRQVDRFIRRNTLDKHGPVRVVKSELVFELAFEAIAESPRHKGGVALRFPRMNRWRTDKKPEDADTIESLRALLPSNRR